ncbi:MAG: VOC family protein [Melioribacteraceae bacterium]|nr:VOC family protein [Melioribacteraceae bacterium]
MISKKTFIILSIFLALTATLYFLYVFITEGNKQSQLEREIFEEKLNSLTTNLLVADVKKSVAFYKDKLGFNLYSIFPDSEEATLAVLQFGRLYIMLQDKEIFKEDKPVYVGGEIPASFSLYIEVNNADSIYKRLIVEEVEVVQDYQPMFYGRKEFSIKDPDGHIITFSEIDKDQFDEIDSLNLELDKYFNRLK